MQLHGEGVTHVSGTKRHPCLGSVTVEDHQADRKALAQVCGTQCRSSPARAGIPVSISTAGVAPNRRRGEGRRSPADVASAGVARHGRAVPRRHFAGAWSCRNPVAPLGITHQPSSRWRERPWFSRKARHAPASIIFVLALTESGKTRGARRGSGRLAGDPAQVAAAPVRPPRRIAEGLPRAFVPGPAATIRAGAFMQHSQ